jgi:hypothetical protein
MGRLTTIKKTLDCSCNGPQTYDLRGWNAVGKPIVECRHCGEQTTGPMHAMEADPERRKRRRARLATDGGDTA